MYSQNLKLSVALPVNPDLTELPAFFSGSVSVLFLLSLPVGVTVNVPLVFFGANDEVLGVLCQVESISAASMRHEKPLLAHFNSILHTWMVSRKGFRTCKAAAKPQSVKMGQSDYTLGCCNATFHRDSRL